MIDINNELLEYKKMLNGLFTIVKYLEQQQKENQKQVELVVSNITIKRLELFDEWLSESKKHLHVFFSRDITSFTTINHGLKNHFKFGNDIQIMEEYFCEIVKYAIKTGSSLFTFPKGFPIRSFSYFCASIGAKFSPYDNHVKFGDLAIFNQSIGHEDHGVTYECYSIIVD